MLKSYTCNYTIVVVLLMLIVIVIHCLPPEKMKVLIRMMDTQENFFRQEVIDSFSTTVGFEVINYQLIDSLESSLADNAGQVALIKIPFDKSWELVEKGKILPLQNFLSKDELQKYNETFLFTSLGRKQNKQYFIPRKFETRIMVYRKSKVKDALGCWEDFRDSLSQVLATLNGFGLPTSYNLESNPDLWDYYDIFVLGWIWAHREFNGTIQPRIAHRGKKYSGTAHRLVDRIIQCKGNSAQIVTMDGEAVVDVFYWEALYAALGIYNAKMWEERWQGTDIWQGFKNNEVFLSFLTQLDCFYLHGTGRDGLQGYIDDPDDMGVATMPRGCTFQLNEKGFPQSIGSKAITTGGWWWGIPADSPNPKLAYQLAMHIVNNENQVQGCTRFGMLPVRKDVRENMKTIFKEKWIQRIFDISYRQMIYNKSNTVSDHNQYSAICGLYCQAWYDIVVNRQWSQNKSMPDRFYIKKLLDIKYIPQARKYCHATRF